MPHERVLENSHLRPQAGWGSKWNVQERHCTQLATLVAPFPDNTGNYLGPSYKSCVLKKKPKNVQRSYQHSVFPPSLTQVFPNTVFNASD